MGPGFRQDDDMVGAFAGTTPALWREPPQFTADINLSPQAFA
jgi:hypothetical protein